MKKFSSRLSVAVHILTLIALNSKSFTSEQIAESVQTNPVIIRRIIGKLKKAGMVSVRAGAGGTTINKNLHDISLLDIYKAVEVVEEGELFHCHQKANADCLVGANIETVFKLKMQQVQSVLEGELAKVTLFQIVNEIKKG